MGACQDRQQGNLHYDISHKQVHHHMRSLLLYPNSADATDFVAPVKSKVLEDTDLGTVQHREDGDWADREKGTRLILRGRQ